jgi:hypothetical protein
MSAMSSAATQPAMIAGQDRAKRMPSAMHGIYMCMATAASIIIIDAYPPPCSTWNPYQP